jgi:hypothetical protein
MTLWNFYFWGSERPSFEVKMRSLEHSPYLGTTLGMLRSSAEVPETTQLSPARLVKALQLLAPEIWSRPRAA